MSAKRGPTARKPDQVIWTPELVERLRALWLSGLSASQIAEKFGWRFSRSAVIGKIHREGITRPKETHEAAMRNAQRQVAAARRQKRQKELDAQRAARLAKLARIPATPRQTRAKPKARLVIAGSNCVLTVPDAPPPIGAAKSDAFAPLPGSTPRVWTERPFGGCSWPVGGEGADMLACCEPVHAYGWCQAHVARGRNPLTNEQRRLERYIQRIAA